MAQQALDFDRPVSPVDPNAHQDDLKRLGKLNHEILDRLRQGPATNVELNEICFRYGARIHDLRRHGYAIKSKRAGGALWIFTLEAG